MNKTPSFVGKDNISEKITSFIKSENKKRNFPFNNELFQPEYVTQCERRIIYRAVGETNSSSRSQLKNHDIKGRWISDFMRMNDVSVLGFDVPVEDLNNNIGGIIDVVLSFDTIDLKSICMIHPIDEEGFSKVRQNGAVRRDVLSSMLYMWLIEIPSSIIVYENILNKEFEIFHAIPHNDYIDAAIRKYKKLIPYKLKNELPDRPSRCNSFESKECKICEFRDKCWKL